MVGHEAGEVDSGLLGVRGELLEDLNKLDIIYCLLCFTLC